MKLTLTEIDPTLAARIREHPRFAAVMAVSAADMSRQGATVKRVLRALIALAGMAAGQIALLLLGKALTPQGGGAAMIFFFCALAVPPVLATIWFQKTPRPRPLPAEKLALQPLGLTEWRVFQGLMSLSGAQKSYADAVTTILELAHAGTFGEAQAHGMLKDVNELAASDRTLLDQQQGLARLTNREDTKKLSKERDALVARRDAASDPTARAALEQSLVLLDERIAQANELGPLWERVGAQREVVAQTLASLSGALLRLKVAPGAAQVATFAATTEAERAGETARSIVQQTRAVEQAVQELVGARTGN